MTTVEDYLKNLDYSQKTEYERIRKIVTGLAPEVVEVISYGIPAFKFKGKILLFFGVFKDHMSIFPAGSTLSLKDELKGFKVLKGTIQFSTDHPVPENVIKQIVLEKLAK